MNIDIGNRIFTKVNRADRELVEAFRDIPSSNINDMMNRLFCMRETIERRGKHEKQLLGTAVTVKVSDGDNAFIHLAMDMLEPGDVLVVDGNGCTSRSLMGEIMFTYCRAKGCAGIIVDGAIRDLDSLDRLDIPVYAASVTPQGPYKNGTGEINVPVACGGQVVYPGDILVGDADGVVVIHREDAPLLIEASQKKFASEEKKLAEYRRGELSEAEHNAPYAKLAKALGTGIYDEVKVYNK